MWPNFSRKHFSLLTVLCVGIVLLSLAPASGSAEKEIPITKFSQNVGGYGATMTFLYWYVKSDSFAYYLLIFRPIC